MLIILVGPSATGKTEVGKVLDKKYHIKKVVTYTTREKRVGEKDGIDYHFVSRVDFGKMILQNKFIEFVNYNDNYYGTSLDSLKDDGYIIVEPKGFEKYYNSDVNYKAFFLRATKELRLERMLKRGDSEDKALERIRIDNRIFNKRIQGLTNYIIDTDDLSVEEIAEEIINKIKE